jgi:RNA polymerase sigma-70 factor, ECF subfamily
LETTDEHIREQVDSIDQAQSRRVFATLVRLLGDFDLAEDALQDDFRAAGAVRGGYRTWT